jgi:hypothetical protein
MPNDLIYPIEVKASPTANGGWEYKLLVGKMKCGSSVFSDEWVSPDKILPTLIKRIVAY